jgi:maleate isomerase
MTALPFQLLDDRRVRLGLIVLQADETCEDELHQILPSETSLLVSRIRSGTDVTPESLAEMEGRLSGAASLFPVGAKFDALGYACTSATAQIGADKVAANIRAGTQTDCVTDPVTALVAACSALGISKLALVSPYVETVSERLRITLLTDGIETPVFASFDVAEEALVARIDPASVADAARAMIDGTDVDGLFLSCTNLRTIPVIAGLEAELNVPVLSSNLVLAWHMLTLAGPLPPGTRPSALLT